MDRSSSSRRRLCFVNSYNAPTVEPSEERRRRAHVTRANFANRRRRLAAQRSHRQLSAASEGASPASHDSTSASETHTPGSVPRDADCWTCDPLAFPSCPPADFLIQFLLHEFRPVIFPSGNGLDGSPGVQLWVDLYRSEPALVEASMSITTGRYPKGLDPGRSVVHAYRAIQMVNQRLEKIETSIGDGLLAAVFTLSFREELLGSRQAKLAHSRGLLQMMRLRRQHTKKDIPGWLSDLILYEAMSDSLALPWVSDGATLSAMPDGYDGMVESLTKVSAGAGLLLDPIRAYRNGILTGDGARASIQRQMDRLHQLIEPLAKFEGVYVSALARSLHIFLHLLWPPRQGVFHLAALASDLRLVLSRPAKRLCTSIKLTAWQFFVGAVAAGRDTEDGTWFMRRLTSMMERVDPGTWNMMKAAIEEAFPADDGVFSAFRDVYDEVASRRLL